MLRHVSLPPSDALAQRDGILSTVGDAFHNVTGAIADGITNYTTAVGNATRNAIDDDNSGASFPVSQSMYAALAGSIVVGALLI